MSAHGDAENSIKSVVKLIEEDEIYRATDVGIYRNSFFKNKELLYTRSESPVIGSDSDLPIHSGNVQGQRLSGINAEQSSNADSISSDSEASNEGEQVNARTSWPFGTTADETQSIVEFFSTANKSSGFHELWHHVFRVLTDAAELSDASDLLKHDVGVILKNAGVSREDFYGNVGNARRIAHEFFAKSGEAYLREGIAPTPELVSTFERIKQWLVEIYQNIKESLGIELNDEMRDIFDRLLATPEQLAEQKSASEIDALYDATREELEFTQQEIERIEAELGNVNDTLDQTDNWAFDSVREQIETVRKQYQGTDQWFKAPNGNPSNLNESQWLLVRTPGFKRWFGDWESVSNAYPSITASTRKEAAEVLNNLRGKELKSEAENIVATISKDGREKMVSGAAMRKSLDNGFSAQDHFTAVANIEKLFKNSVKSNERSDDNGQLKAIEHFSSLFMLKNQPALVTFTVKVTENAGRKIYSIEVMNLSRVEGMLPENAVKAHRASSTPDLLNISRIADIYNNASKVVDENGEPLVVDIEGFPVFVNNDGLTMPVDTGYGDGTESYAQDQDGQSKAINKKRTSSKVKFSPNKIYTATRQNGTQALYMHIVKRLPRKKQQRTQTIVVQLSGYGIDNNWGYIETYAEAEMNGNTEIITFTTKPEFGREPFIFRADGSDENTNGEDVLSGERQVAFVPEFQVDNTTATDEVPPQ